MGSVCASSHSAPQRQPRVFENLDACDLTHTPRPPLCSASESTERKEGRRPIALARLSIHSRPPRTLSTDRRRLDRAVEKLLQGPPSLRFQIEVRRPPFRFICIMRHLFNNQHLSKSTHTSLSCAPAGQTAHKQQAAGSGRRVSTAALLAGGGGVGLWWMLLPRLTALPSVSPSCRRSRRLIGAPASRVRGWTDRSDRRGEGRTHVVLIWVGLNA